MAGRAGDRERRAAPAAGSMARRINRAAPPVPGVRGARADDGDPQARIAGELPRRCGHRPVCFCRDRAAVRPEHAYARTGTSADPHGPRTEPKAGHASPSIRARRRYWDHSACRHRSSRPPRRLPARPLANIFLTEEGKEIVIAESFEVVRELMQVGVAGRRFACRDRPAVVENLFRRITTDPIVLGARARAIRRPPLTRHPSTPSAGERRSVDPSSRGTGTASVEPCRRAG